MSSLKVFISSPVYVTIYPANRVSFDLPRWVRKDRRDSASRVVTIDPGTSSVVASPFCLVELWLAIFWALFTRFSSFLVVATERGFLCLFENL